MNKWARGRLSLLSPESYARFDAAAKDAKHFDDDVELRKALLDFIADFANWDNSTIPEYLETSRALTQAAHEALGGAHGTKPLVVDPFAGGGSIPLEALRIGADAFASDLNPVAVLLNKVVLEYIPRYGERLAEEVREWGRFIRRETEKELSDLYPSAEKGEQVIAYLWARTIRCEGPGCGAEVPLVRSPWLAKKSDRGIALQLVPRPRTKRVDLKILRRRGGTWFDQDDEKSLVPKPSLAGTVQRGSATCPCCGYSTPVGRVREQLKARRGGAADARLLCVVSTRDGETGRHYRLATEADHAAVRRAEKRLAALLNRTAVGDLPPVPDEPLDVRGIRHTWAMIYGLSRWCDFFTPRQALLLATFAKHLNRQGQAESNAEIPDFGMAIQSCLALALGRQADALSSCVTWTPGGEFQGHTFARQALPFVWDFAEVNPLSDSSGCWAGAVEWVAKVCESGFQQDASATCRQSTATAHPLPDDSAHGVVTDPPYYDAVPYAYLSDYFHVWLRRVLARVHPDLFRRPLVPKDEEIVVDRAHELSDSTHDLAYYERELGRAFSECRRVLRPDGVGTIVFASKTTASWEAILAAVVESGWTITASWPVDTEREARVSAQGQARLGSSVHLVCRPREAPDGSVRTDDVADWKAVLAELPKRIGEWMPRLTAEGVVGADAIFACLGPALEIFSRYSRVEKASGEVVTLKEYLEHVWAAVAKEALSMIFADPETSGLEPDARLTAMWLWTVAAPAAAGATEDEEAEPAEDDEDDGRPAGKLAGFVIEFDAARKIAQGLGAKLEEMPGVVEVKGEKARLLPVSERARFLFGGGRSAGPDSRAARGRGRVKQGNLFQEVEEVAEEAERSELGAPGEAKTTLDRIHQAMLLFGAGRSEALRRFLVDDGAGRATGFWKLAQSLSALYSKASEEKRWVDGVLARKKSLGF